MKSGLPSATARIRSRAAASTPLVGAEPVEQRLGLVGRQRVEQDRRAAQPAAAPVRPDVQQVGTREAEHEHRRAGELDERLDEVEEGGRGPVDVLEDEQQRPLAREAGEQPPRGPGRLLRPCPARAQADGGGEPVGELRAVLLGARRSRIQAGEIAVGERGEQRRGAART